MLAESNQGCIQRVNERGKTHVNGGIHGEATVDLDIHEAMELRPGHSHSVDDPILGDAVAGQRRGDDGNRALRSG